MQDQIYEQENEISLVDLFLMIKKYFLFLVAFTLLGGAIASIYAFGISPKTYQADVQIMVAGQHQAVKDFIISDAVILEAIDNLDLNMSVSSIQEGLTITFNTASKFMDISLKLDQRNYTRNILNEILNVAADYSDNNTLYASYKGLMTYPTGVSGEYRVGPNYFLIIFIGMLLGGIVSLGYVFIKEMMFPKYHTKEALEKSLDCDCLGLIPSYDQKGGQKNA